MVTVKLTAKIREGTRRKKDKKEVDLFADSFGAWKRDESAEETVRKSRLAFTQSMHHHHAKEG